MERNDSGTHVCVNIYQQLPKMVCVLLVLLVTMVRLINADIYFDSGTCGTTYDADYYKSFDVQFRGSDNLFHNPCSIEFIKSSYKQFLCVSGQEIHLECGTKLEYHEGFVKNYISPEVEMSCNSVTLAEWCPSKYQDNIFIVIRKSTDVQTNDVVKLRVYLKDAPDEEYESHIKSTLIITILPVVIVVIIIIIAIVVRRKGSQGSRPLVLYRTTSGADRWQTGPATGGHQPPQQHFAGPQGNYNVHPMQRAYPVNEGSPHVHQPLFPQDVNTAGISANRQLSAAAPALETDAPPPSYESVVGWTK